MAQNFIKNKEDFTCEHCGGTVKGNGYTNHCPKCLWSKHVDTVPGDRTADCGGLMEPVSLEQAGGEFVLTYKCLKCGHQKPNKTAPEDDISDFLGKMI